MNYYVALGVVTFVWLLFSLALRGVALVPFAGPVVSLCLSPVPTVYCFRFIAHFCDEERLSAGRDEDVAGTVSASAPVSAWTLATELLAWMLIMSVLVVLCFTPMVLVFGYISRFFP